MSNLLSKPFGSRVDRHIPVYILLKFNVNLFIGFFGVLFQDQKTEVFTVFKLFNAFGTTFYFACGNHLCIRTKLFIVIAFYLVGICLYAHVYRGYAKKSKEDSRNDTNIELKLMTKETWFLVCLFFTFGLYFLRLMTYFNGNLTF